MVKKYNLENLDEMEKYEHHMRQFINEYKVTHPKMNDFFQHSNIMILNGEFNIETTKKYRKQQSRMHKALNRESEMIVRM